MQGVTVCLPVSKLIHYIHIHSHIHTTVCMWYGVSALIRECLWVWWPYCRNFHSPETKENGGWFVGETVICVFHIY